MSILAKHAQGKGGPDTIFAYAGAAAARAREVGTENIVNATIGAFLTPDGHLATMKTVQEAMEAIPFEVAANYAPINGLPAFIDAMADSVFRDYRPDCFIDGVATPGGTGAVHNATYNYLNEGDVCLTTDYFWGNYASLLSEFGRKLETFNTFTPDGGFDVDACLVACKAKIAQQQNLVLLLNTPAHNPTGMTVSEAEWQKLLSELSALAEANPDHGVIVILDVAYIDYAPQEARRMFKLFENLPHNMLGIVCASLSKGYTLYGYRLGVELCMAPTEALKDEFMLAAGASCRSTWSNCSRVGMEMVAALAADPLKLKNFRAEQDDFAAQLAQRADVFTSEAKEVGLTICPYHSGFFIYVPTKTHADAEALTKKVAEKDIFVVPLGKGVRIAICAIDIRQIKGMAKIFKDAQVALGL